MSRVLDRLASTKGMVMVIEGLTSSGTAGTRSSHAHGLVDHVGRKIAPTAVTPISRADDTDGLILNAAEVYIVAFDKDEVTVRANDTNVPFDLIVL